MKKSKDNLNEEEILLNPIDKSNEEVSSHLALGLFSAAGFGLILKSAVETRNKAQLFD